MAKRPRRSAGLAHALGFDKSRRGSSKSLLKASVPHEALRRASPTENVRMGFTPKARRYVKAGVKVTKATASVSARQAETKRVRERYGLASPEIATKAREHGALSYKNAHAESAAQKNRAAAYGRRLGREIERAARRGERIPEYAGPNDPKPLTKRVRKGRRTFTVRTGFQARQSHVGRMMELRQRKLAGEELDNGDWHMLMDYAEYFGDPERSRLRNSPGSFTAHESVENE
jgi:hypothetical protein